MNSRAFLIRKFIVSIRFVFYQITYLRGGDVVPTVCEAEMVAVVNDVALFVDEEVVGYAVAFESTSAESN